MHCSDSQHCSSQASARYSLQNSRILWEIKRFTYPMECFREWLAVHFKCTMFHSHFNTDFISLWERGGGRETKLSSAFYFLGHAVKCSPPLVGKAIIPFNSEAFTFSHVGKNVCAHASDIKIFEMFRHGYPWKYAHMRRPHESNGWKPARVK